MQRSSRVPGIVILLACAWVLVNGQPALAQEDGICGDTIVGNSPGETCDPAGNPAGGNGNLCRYDCTVCGDGVVNNYDEECDDGNGINDDDCRNDCLIPNCGDGVLDPNETCDPPGEPAGGNGNLCREDCTVCGDGVVQAGEECDDANGSDLDGCANYCGPTECGDGIVHPGESCDPPGAPAGANGNPCREDCTVCGDGIVQDDEVCDDGNSNDSDGCPNQCLLEPCSDGTIQPGESCDPPGAPAGGNGNLCREDCTVCGDGIVNAGEECDDGSPGVCDGCNDNCTIPICGDELLCQGQGETCDPPGAPGGANGNLCREDCTVCGDGIVNASEECDDGNGENCDSCTNFCGFDECGDGVILCGGVSCDPPGEPAGGNGNLCREDCSVCGDAIVNAGEECDDGNGIDTDSCTNACTIRDCGDSIIQDGETCDPPGGPGGEGGNLCREDCTFCGDGVLDAEEACDDGNQAGGDLCSALCEEEPLIGCRVSGGGMALEAMDGPRGHGGPRAFEFSGHVGGCCVGCFEEVGVIAGRWSHEGRQGSLDATGFNSLVCTCDGVLEDGVCIVDDQKGSAGPYRAPANKACWSGIGEFESEEGGRVRAAFRLEVDDSGMPAQDSYQLRIWVPISGETAEDLAALACCTHATVEGRPADLDEGAIMIQGGIQIHPAAPEAACRKAGESCTSDFE